MASSSRRGAPSTSAGWSTPWTSSPRCPASGSPSPARPRHHDGRAGGAVRAEGLLHVPGRLLPYDQSPAPPRRGRGPRFVRGALPDVGGAGEAIRGAVPGLGGPAVVYPAEPVAVPRGMPPKPAEATRRWTPWRRSCRGIRRCPCSGHRAARSCTSWGPSSLPP